MNSLKHIGLSSMDSSPDRLQQVSLRESTFKMLEHIDSYDFLDEDGPQDKCKCQPLPTATFCLTSIHSLYCSEELDQAVGTVF